MVYAVMTDADKTPLATQFFASKKIPEQNLCPVNNLGSLVQRLSQGDTVWVLDVDRFGSAILFWRFYQECMQRGVLLKFFANPYLNLGQDRRLKKSYIQIIEYLICVEKKISHDICNAFKITNTAEVQRYAGHIAVNTLAEIFCTNGIMKRTAS